MADIMRRTRATCHYAILAGWKHEQDYVNQSFAESILSNKNHDFWGEVKRLLHSGNICSSSVDGFTSPGDQISSLSKLLFSFVSSSVSVLTLILKQPVPLLPLSSTLNLTTLTLSTTILLSLK